MENKIVIKHLNTNDFIGKLICIFLQNVFLKNIFIILLNKNKLKNKSKHIKFNYKYNYFLNKNIFIMKIKILFFYIIVFNKKIRNMF